MSSSIPPLPPPNDQTRELLQFLREENAANRTAVREDAEANRRLLLDTVRLISIPAAVVIAVAAFFGIRSISDLKETLEAEARRSTQVEINKMQNEIQNRLSDQFKTPALQQMVNDAAASYTKSAADPLIKQEVATQVRTRVDAEKPTIVAAVTEQTKSAVNQMAPQINEQVRDSVEATVQTHVAPVVQTLSDIKADAGLQDLIIRMDNDDALAFDQLLSLSGQTTDLIKKNEIQGALMEVIATHQSGLQVVQTFNVPRSKEQMLALLDNKAAYRTEREAAVWALSALPEMRSTLLPKLVVMLTSDPSLSVRCTAARQFDAYTNQGFGCLDKDNINKWWAANEATFSNAPKP